MTQTQQAARNLTLPEGASRRRVVITGMGIVNPIGSTLESFWDALQHGRSGVRPLKAFDAARLPVRFAGEVVDFDARGFIDKKERKSLKVMSRGIQMAVVAAQLAMDDAKIDKSRLDPTRFGVEFGSGLIASELQELAAASLVSGNCKPGTVDLQKWGAEGIPTIPPLWMLKYLPNMLACHVSVLHNAQGPNNTITEGDVAGLLAIGEAYHIMRRDQADVFLAGAAESKVNPLSMVRQCLFGKLSARNDAPDKASRPFDRQRDGLVLGEGGAVLVLEDLAHAQQRGARIYAEIVGFGAAFDRERSGTGLARAMRSAMKHAGVTPEDIGHVNANGTSNVDIDIWESKGIQEVFGGRSRPVPVFAPKSYFGSVGAAGGPSELAASVLAASHGVIPRTLNYEEPDPACPLAVTREPQPATRHVLKLCFTEMGQCAALVFRPWE